jgi:ribokinase
MQFAVVGHVEWVTFLPVDRPPLPGAILRAANGWTEPAGGGGVAVAELARLAHRATLFTAVGHDARGAAIRGSMAALNVNVIGPTRPIDHRTAITLIDPSAERTIVVVGPVQQIHGSELPNDAFVDTDGVYFCKGDEEAVRKARSARMLVATARVLPTLRESGVALDALVMSANDPNERYEPGDLTPAPRLVAVTNGRKGGTWRAANGDSGHWSAGQAPKGGDSYGCGDSFAAGLTYALARGDDPASALRFAAQRGAQALGRRGAHLPAVPKA